MSAASQREAPTVSVIVPALDEAGYIEATLESLKGAAEVIVVDGGSVDGTPEIARAKGAQVLLTPPGRGIQMNAGAAQASGDILLFLHADTAAPPNFALQIREVMDKTGTVGGVFRLAIGLDSVAIRWIERTVELRTRLLGLPYGDQGLFVYASTFRAVGGFPETPIMEDVVLVRRLLRHGRIGLAPGTVLTSGRRWKRLGLLRTSFINVTALAMHFLGVSPEVIARWYHGSGQPSQMEQEQGAPAGSQE